MRIPEIATRFREIADAVRGGAVPDPDEIDRLARELRRRPCGAKAEPKCRRMTKRLEGAIRAFAAEHPEMSQFEIGEHFNVNQGRVSESLKGKRQ